MKISDSWDFEIFLNQLQYLHEKCFRNMRTTLETSLKKQCFFDCTFVLLCSIKLLILNLQIVVGSFMPNGCYKTHKRKHYRERTVCSPTPTAPSLALCASDMVTAASPISQAKPYGETYMTDASPLTATGNIEAENGAIMTENTNATSNIASWNGLGSEANYGPSPDINVSAPGE